MIPDPFLKKRDKHRDLIVLISKFGLEVTKINSVLAGGSSKIFNIEFAASLFGMHNCSASQISIVRHCLRSIDE